MASITISGGQTFPEGTSVSAYPRTAWPSFQPPSGAPSGSATAGPVTVTNNAATFNGLTEGVQYVAYAASPNRYKNFMVPTPAAGSTPADLSILTRQLADLARTGGWLPTGWIDQTVTDRVAASSSGLNTGQLRLVGGVVIPGGRTVTNISFMSNTTAGAAMTNQWFCLVDRASLNVLGVTADDGATAWAASSMKTLALATPYTPANATEVYLGCCVVGTTPPNLVAATNLASPLAPVMAGSSNGGLTNPASLPSPVTAPTAITTVPYAGIS